MHRRGAVEREGPLQPEEAGELARGSLDAPPLQVAQQRAATCQAPPHQLPGRAPLRHLVRVRVRVRVRVKVRVRIRVRVRVRVRITVAVS